MSDSQISINEKRLQWFEKLSKNFSIIPLRGKKPVENNWSKWCEEKRPFNTKDFIGKNAGIATGPSSGLIVLDIDNQALFESFRRRHGYPDLPKTFKVRSGGSTPGIKKCHFYFKYPNDGKQYGKKAFRILGFDLLGTGAQVVAPLSVHPDTGNEYEIEDHQPFADPPGWLLELFTTKRENWTAVDPDKLKVSDDIRQLIKEGKPKGQRSEAMMKVINAMVSAGYSEDQIFYVFYTRRIGEKHIERGAARDRQLEKEIEKAGSYVRPQKVEEEDHDEFGLNIVWGHEFIERPYVLNYVIEDFLEENGLLFLIGPTGIGKSIFTLNIAMAAATAQPLWNKFEIPRPLKSIMIQSENSAVGVHDRMKRMVAGEPSWRAGLRNIALPEIDGHHRIMGLSFKDPKFKDLVFQLKDQTDADILFVDPLVSYAGVDENNNSEMRRSLDILTKLAMQLKLSIILVHHCGKAGDLGVNSPRGASSSAGWTGNMLLLGHKKISDQEYIVVKNEKKRYGEKEKPLHLIMDQNLILRVKELYDSMDYGKIIELFKKNNGFFDTKTKLTEELKDTMKLSKNKARELIDELVNKDCIAVTKDGNKNRMIYTLTSVF